MNLESSSVQQHQQANVLYDVIETHAEVIDYNNAGFVFTDATHAFGQRQQYRTSSTYTGPGDIFESRSGILNINWQYSDALVIRSIRGGRNFKYGNFQDLDASVYAYFEQWFYQKDEEYSQEFRILGESARLAWAAGLYFDAYRTDQRAVRWQYEELFSRPRNEVTFTKRRDSAVYAEGTYAISDQLALTLGLRYSIEDFANANYLSAEARPAPGMITKNIERGTLVQANNADFKSTTPRASLSYKWNENIMTYLTYSEGFNGGGVNGTPIGGEFLTYTSELLAQYEFGLRADIFDDRVRFNAAYFNGSWDNIQVAEVLTPAILTTRNAGEAEVEGLEVDLLWAVNNRLALNFSAGWLNTGFTDVGDTTTITVGSSFSLAPELSYSVGVSYDWPITSSGSTVTFRTDYGWLDDHYTINDIRLQKLQESYGLLSGKVSYRPGNSFWDVSLFGTNLTDEWYQVSGFSATLSGIDQGIVARPREFGITVGITF